MPSYADSKNTFIYNQIASFKEENWPVVNKIAFYALQ